MKKKERQTVKGVQTQTAVSAILEEFWFVEKLVEGLADQSDNRYSGELVHTGWQAIETSSNEAHICGNFFLSDNSNAVCIPFTSSFFFTCTSESEDMKLSWSNSLS